MTSPRPDPSCIASVPALVDAVAVYGMNARVTCDDAQLLARLRQRWPPGSRRIEAAEAAASYSVTRLPHSGPRVWYRCAANGEPFVDAADEELACDQFEFMVRFDLARTTTEWTFVHAGVVGWRGRALVIPAPSGQGKSNLVAALVEAGATYYSDECAVFDRDGRVHAYPLPLSLKNEGRLRRIALADGATPLPPALPLGLVAVARFTGVTALRRATHAAGVLALLANAVQARIAPARTMRTLARAVSGSTVIEGSRGEADVAASRLLEEMG